MGLIKLWFVTGLAIVGVAGWTVVSGWTPTTTRSEVVPVSVRANPASYKPTYRAHLGYHTFIVVHSSGRRTGGGGYRYGK